MKIAFWSNTRGKNGVTSNLTCVSIMGAIDGTRKTLLLENHYNINNLENALIKQDRTMVKEESYFYNQIGLDSLIKRVHSRMVNESSVQEASISLMNGTMHYIPQSHISNKEFFEYEFNQVIHPLFRVLEDFGDVVYVDTAGCDHLSSKVILNEADLVVVNLSQNPLILSNYFKNYSSLHEKAVYLIGNYNPDSRFNLKNIIRMYHIDKNKIAVIPYNIEYKDAVAEGNAIRFLMRNFDCGKEEPNYYFIREVKKAVNMINNQMKNVRKEELVE